MRLAPAWIRESRSGRNANRVGLLDGPMLDACGDVRGARALDCGCGEGRFCRMLAERGATYVLGLDLCEPMIEAARGMQGARDEYRVADVEDLAFLSDATFDVAVSYLNQCDLADWEANTREVWRVLRAPGRFVVANLHPMRSAIGEWRRAPDGTKEHVVLDRYLDEGPRRWSMLGSEFTNYHRTLQTYVGGFRRAGFAVEAILEPTVSEQDLAEYPELADETRVPNFIVYVLRKEEPAP
jgi:SAM-dependent methyltransferase